MNTYGLTGKIQFDEEGIRKKFAFKVYQLEHKSPLRYVSQSYVTNKLCHIRLCFYLCILLTSILCFYLSLSINVHCPGNKVSVFVVIIFVLKNFVFALPLLYLMWRLYFIFLTSLEIFSEILVILQFVISS